MSNVPSELHGRVFQTSDALEFGVNRRMLQSSAYASIFPGVYRTAGTTPTLHLLLAAAQLILPDDAAVSHLTCLRLLGFEMGPTWPLHFSTNDSTHHQRKGLVIHRRQGDLNCTQLDGIRAVGPLRTFVDVATLVSDMALLRVGDWLLARDLIDTATLANYLADSHLNGIQRARRVAPQIRAGSASPQESNVRWSLVSAGLPEPELNVDIHDDNGTWLARGDLVYRRWKVLVEYDGRHHQRDPRQWQWDLRRREQLEAAGWRVIIVTSADMQNLALLVLRVRQALRKAGYPG